MNSPTEWAFDKMKYTTEILKDLFSSLTHKARNCQAPEASSIPTNCFENRSALVVVVAAAAELATIRCREIRNWNLRASRAIGCEIRAIAHSQTTNSIELLLAEF